MTDDVVVDLSPYLPLGEDEADQQTELVRAMRTLADRLETLESSHENLSVMLLAISARLSRSNATVGHTALWGVLSARGDDYVEQLSLPVVAATYVPPTIFVQEKGPAWLAFERTDPVTDIEAAEDARAPDQHEVARLIRSALANPAYDFRTIPGIASEINLQEAEVEQFLDAHPDLVRWVPATDADDRPLLLDASRAVSRRERLMELRAALTGFAR